MWCPGYQIIFFVQFSHVFKFALQFTMYNYFTKIWQQYVSHINLFCFFFQIIYITLSSLNDIIPFLDHPTSRQIHITTNLWSVNVPKNMLKINFYLVYFKRRVDGTIILINITCLYSYPYLYPYLYLLELLKTTYVIHLCSYLMNLLFYVYPSKPAS